MKELILWIIAIYLLIGGAVAWVWDPLARQRIETPDQELRKAMFDMERFGFDALAIVRVYFVIAWPIAIYRDIKRALGRVLK